MGKNDDILWGMTISHIWGRWLGNGLILMGLGGLLLTFYPLLREEVGYRVGVSQEIMVESGYTVEIPSLRLKAAVIEGVDPYNSGVYREALNRGVAQAKHTALPGEKGTQYLFAHSSDNPWNLARANTAFYRLTRIKVGDEILVDYQGREYRYRVSETRTVRPTEVSYLEEQAEDRLILQTCVPIGTDWKRFLVLAIQVVD
jgi:LPXTG-site transpeptidase (sortase) family protein